jgi:hypothetical protein
MKRKHFEMASNSLDFVKQKALRLQREYVEQLPKPPSTPLFYTGSGQLVCSLHVTAFDPNPYAVIGVPVPPKWQEASLAKRGEFLQCEHCLVMELPARYRPYWDTDIKDWIWPE